MTQSFLVFFYRVKLIHVDATKSTAKDPLDKTGEHETVQQAKDIIIIPPDNSKWTLITEKPTSVPHFSMSNIIDYFVLRKACDKESTNDFKNLLGKSYPLFKCGHVQSIKFHDGPDSDPDKTYLCCKCLPEMKKNVEYKLKIVLRKSDGKILYASCGCIAGKGPNGSCKHIGSFCYAIEEFVELGFSRGYVSCTSKLQEWNKPRAKKLKPRSIYEISFIRHKHPSSSDTVKKRKRESKIVKEFDPRPLKYRNKDLTDRLKDSLNKYKINSGFSKLFSPDVSDRSKVESNSIVSYDCMVLSEIQNLSTCETISQEGNESTDSESRQILCEQTPNKCWRKNKENVADPVPETKVREYMNSLKLDKKQREELEMRTKSQSESTEWIRVRKKTNSFSLWKDMWD